MPTTEISHANAAAILAITPERLEALRRAGHGPRLTHVHDRTFYTEDALHEWARAAAGTDDARHSPAVLAAAKALFARNHPGLPWGEADEDDRAWYIAEASDALAAAASAGWAPDLS